MVTTIHTGTRSQTTRPIFRLHLQDREPEAAGYSRTWDFVLSPTFRKLLCFGTFISFLLLIVSVLPLPRATDRGGSRENSGVVNENVWKDAHGGVVSGGEMVETYGGNVL